MCIASQISASVSSDFFYYRKSQTGESKWKCSVSSSSESNAITGSSNGGDSDGDVTWKVISRSFKLRRAYSISFNL